MNASNITWYPVNRKNAGYLTNEAFSEPTSDKIDKGGGGGGAFSLLL